MADINGDAFPERINGDIYPEVPIALQSNPHLGWHVAQANFTSCMTFGFDAIDQFLYLNPYSTSLENSTFKTGLGCSSAASSNESHPTNSNGESTSEGEALAIDSITAL